MVAYARNGSPNPDFVLNQPQYQGSQILVAGRNFGIGSSREHAVWALTQYGFRAVISPAFADIFYNNSLKNGLLPIRLPEETVSQLLDLVEEVPHTSISIDLPSQTITLPEFPSGKAGIQMAPGHLRSIRSASNACCAAWTTWAIFWTRRSR